MRRSVVGGGRGGWKLKEHQKYPKRVIYVCLMYLAAVGHISCFFFSCFFFFTLLISF